MKSLLFALCSLFIVLCSNNINFAKKTEMGLLRTILILFIIFYVIKLVTRYILPALFYNYMDDKMEELTKQKQKQRQQQQQARKREGEVTVNYSPKDQLKNKPAKGDYIDYVEVKD
jgi:Tfp pilus assembly protein PilO